MLNLKNKFIRFGRRGEYLELEFIEVCEKDGVYSNYPSYGSCSCPDSRG